MFALQVLFWSPMVYRLARRETPDTSFGDELRTSHRIPGIVLYQIGLALMWTGLGMAFWGGRMNRHVTLQGLAGAGLHVAAMTLLTCAFAVHRSWNIQPRLERDHPLCTTGHTAWCGTRFTWRSTFSGSAPSSGCRTSWSRSAPPP